jgi:hypothetical protein
MVHNTFRLEVRVADFWVASEVVLAQRNRQLYPGSCLGTFSGLLRLLHPIPGIARSHGIADVREVQDRNPHHI